MHTKFTQLLLAGALFFSLLPPIALATPEEDLASAEKSLMEEDIKEATRFLKLAADQNYLPAQVRLGEFMYGATEYDEAFGWFLTAAYQGDAAGQFNLGQMYVGGFGVDKNQAKALFWYKKAAEQSFLPAVRLLAAAYDTLKNNSDSKKTSVDSLIVEPNQEQADFWSAKIPELEIIEAKRTKQVKAAILKRNAEAKAKAKEAESKLLCGLKC
jgi:TPR repeat protein